MSDPKNKDSQPAQAEPVDAARRRLLGMAKYVPPVILGVISLQQAGCQPEPSCGPSGMPPPPLPSNHESPANTSPNEVEVDPNAGS